MKARVALRINPDIDAQTHPYISTGLKKNKFGIDLERALEDYAGPRQLPHVEVVGVACHIGSQITELAPFMEAVERLGSWWRTDPPGDQIRYLDLGGGLGITMTRKPRRTPGSTGRT